MSIHLWLVTWWNGEQELLRGTCFADAVENGKYARHAVKEFRQMD